MTNHLALENSPYLLQHANNPVDWYPWGAEALEKAQKEDKPIFLSIGYAACHWCHVMAHESFENADTASVMNQSFVNIKVDREERPDLDGIYMNAVVAITGSGGWPMSVFLSPDGTPFYGGTYFPPVRRYNMPAFREVLLTIARLWQQDRGELLKAGENLKEHLLRSSFPAVPKDSVDPDLLLDGEQKLLEAYDWQHGGWGRAPKFPQSMAIEFLLRRSTDDDPESLKAALHALDAMARGGIYDVLGGGFARYSTDEEWLVPHFEKMLYDNAQLAQVYLYAYKITEQEKYRRTCEETLDFILRELSFRIKVDDKDQIGFFSSLDADSDGGEGRFYLWSMDEIQWAVRDPLEAQIFVDAFGMTAEGNFEGRNILQRAVSDEVLASRYALPADRISKLLDRTKHQLLAQREKRVRPSTDDKVLVSWNALAMTAFAEAGRYLQRADYLQIARANAEFLLDQLFQAGTLQRSWRNGRARHMAYLEDYAGLSLALLHLYRADPGNHRWFQAARQLAITMIDHFSDSDWGFFDTHVDHEQLLTRPKEIQDNATPSGNSLALLVMLELGGYTGEQHWLERSDLLLRAVQGFASRYPIGFAKWLCAFDTRIQSLAEVAIIGNLQDPATRDLLAVSSAHFFPRIILAASPYPPIQDAPQVLKDRSMLFGKPTAYICHNFICELPVTTPEEFARQLNSA